MVWFILALCPEPAQGPPRAQSPFARSRCYLNRRDVFAPRQRVLHLLRNSYGLMRQTKTLPLFWCYPHSMGLCRLLPVPAGSWPFPALICDSFPGCLDPYPGGICAAYGRFFTQITGLPRDLTSRLEKYLTTTNDLLNNFRGGGCSRGCSHSVMFRPPGLLADQVVLTTGPSPIATSAFTSGQNPRRYLRRHRIC